MTTNENFKRTTVKIPRLLADLIDKYMEDHREELVLSGRRVSRATVVRMAVEEFLKKKGIL